MDRRIYGKQYHEAMTHVCPFTPDFLHYFGNNIIGTADSLQVTLYILQCHSM